MNLDQIDYVPARNGAQGPVDSRKANIIVIHSMECPPDDVHVTNWVRSLASPQGGQFFAHYYCGRSVLYRVAPLGRTVWHVGNGNEVEGLWTLGIEQAGFVAQTRQEWIDSGVLSVSGPLVAALIADGHGENQWLEVADLTRPGARGVTSHNNMSLAFGGSDHTDPGPNYPHDLLLATPVTVSEDNMLASARNVEGRLENFRVTVGGTIQSQWQSVPNGPMNGWSDFNPTQRSAVTGISRGISAVTSVDGRIELFAMDQGFQVWHCWQTIDPKTPNKISGWSVWVKD